MRQGSVARSSASLRTGVAPRAPQRKQARPAKPVVPVASGVEIEFCGLTLAQTAQIVLSVVGGQPVHDPRSHNVLDSQLRVWQIKPEVGCVEVASPILRTTDDRDLFLRVVRALREAGASAASETGVHIHKDGPRFSPRAVTRYVAFMAKYEEPMVRALLIQPQRRSRWCRALPHAASATFARRRPFTEMGLRRTAKKCMVQREWGLNLRNRVGMGKSDDCTIEHRYFDSVLDETVVQHYYDLVEALSQGAIQGYAQPTSPATEPLRQFCEALQLDTEQGTGKFLLDNNQVADTLAQISQALLPELRQLADHPRVNVRAAVVTRMGRLGFAALADVLPFLRDDEALVQENANEAIQRAVSAHLPLSEDALRSLLPLLDHALPGGAMQAIVECLLDKSPPTLMAELTVAMARSRDGIVRDRLHEALEAYGDVPLDVLQELARSPHPQVRARVPRYLPAHGRAGLPLLQTLLASPDTTVSGAALSRADAMFPTIDRWVLLQIAREPQPGEDLASLHGYYEKSVTDLVACCPSASPAALAVIVSALPASDPAALPTLAELCAHPHPGVQEAARRQLCTSTHPAAAPTLLDIIDTDGSAALYPAVDALERLVQNDPQMVKSWTPRLMRWCASPHRVQQDAALSIATAAVHCTAARPVVQHLLQEHAARMTEKQRMYLRMTLAHKHQPLLPENHRNPSTRTIFACLSYAQLVRPRLRNRAIIQACTDALARHAEIEMPGHGIEAAQCIVDGEIHDLLRGSERPLRVMLRETLALEKYQPEAVQAAIGEPTLAKIRALLARH